MKTKIAAFVIAMYAALGLAAAQGKVDLGKREFMNKCAVCHG